jgi:hypothetical protein
MGAGEPMTTTQTHRAAEPHPNPETVHELLVIVRRLLDDERARGQGLDSKTSNLAGFTGATLAIMGGFAGEIATIGLTGLAEAMLRVAFIVAVVALGLSALICMAVILRPQERLAISMEAVRCFSEYPLIADEPIEIQWAAAGLVVGFAAVVVVAICGASVGW